MNRRLAALAVGLTLMVSACGGTGNTGGSSPTASAAAACTVGVSWNNYQEERWAKWDEPAIKAAISAAGGGEFFHCPQTAAGAHATNLDKPISPSAESVTILSLD